MWVRLGTFGIRGSVDQYHGHVAHFCMHGKSVIETINFEIAPVRAAEARLRPRAQREGASPLATRETSLR
eukprot:1611762-Prymnesium_polylepis.1